VALARLKRGPLAGDSLSPLSLSGCLAVWQRSFDRCHIVVACLVVAPEQESTTEGRARKLLSLSSCQHLHHLGLVVRWLGGGSDAETSLWSDLIVRPSAEQS